MLCHNNKILVEEKKKGGGGKENEIIFKWEWNIKENTKVNIDKNFR